MTDKIAKHLKALKDKHAELDKMINEEEARPYSDDLKIQDWKKQKLKIKQEIDQIESK